MEGEHSIPEAWVASFQGRTHFGAHGPRDVLIIESSDLEGPEVVSRRRGRLSLSDLKSLDSQGISSECREDDVRFMEERYRISDTYDVVGVERDPKSVEYITSKIFTLFNNTKKPGVLIHYIGLGRKDTGDWCFKDGFLTFLDLMACYKQYFTHKTLELVSDCSYSGRWMTCLEEYLDREGVQPCGHSAKTTGIQLYLACSCRAYEIPYQLYFSARACCNDKNTRELCINSVTVDHTQHSDVLVATKLRCGAKSFDTSCLLVHDFTWQRRRVSKRLFLDDYSEPQRWELFLLIDDESVVDNVNDRKLNPREYGESIRKGEGEKLSAEDKRWISRKYFGHS